jgi:vacuolar iron transporter family protein
LTLQAYEHPLQQAFGAFTGAFFSGLVGALFYFLLPGYGMWIAVSLLLALAAFLSAKYERNRLIPALIWNLGIGALAAGVAYFLFESLV